MISISSIQPSDHSSLEIACELVDQAQDYESIVLGISFNTHGLTPEDLSSILTDGNGVTFLAFDGVDPVGTLTLIDDARQNWYHRGESSPKVIKFVAVSPGHQGKGIATQLVQRAIRETEELVSVSTDERNTHAIHLYKKCGFSLVEVNRAKSEEGNAVRFAFWLNGCPLPRWAIAEKLVLCRLRVLIKKMIHY